MADGSWSHRDGAEPQGGQLGQGPVSSWARWHLWAFGIGPCHTQGSPARGAGGAVPFPAQCSPSDPPEQGWHHGQEVLAQKSTAPRRDRAHFPPGVKGLLGAPSQRKSPLPRVKHTLEEGNAPRRGLCPLLGPCTSHFAPGVSPTPHTRCSSRFAWPEPFARRAAQPCPAELPGKCCVLW